MDFYEKWIEYDYNPWILFDETGKIIALNQEAQFLFSETSAQEMIFHLAIEHANQSYGFKTTLIDFEIGEYAFFGLMVGYEDDQTIAIRLYQKPKNRIENPDTQSLSRHNIYTLIDLVVSTNSIQRHHPIQVQLDPTLPEIKIDPEQFVALLNHLFEFFENSGPIHLKLSLKIGETLKFEGKRYPIFTLSILGELKKSCSIQPYRSLANRLNGYLIHKEDAIIFEAPLIVD